jgi:hypothetical protein
MTFLTDLAAVLQNSNVALAGVFLRNHYKEIINLVEAAENIRDSHIPNIQQFTNEIEDACPEANEAICELRDELEGALAALDKKPIDPNKWAFDRGLESY